jgi:tRNA-specific 2-thiouridylase
MSTTPLPRPAPARDTVVVAALSGGVDSATAAALMVEAGCRVVGMTMRLYDARGGAMASSGRCCGPRDVEDARKVCAHLDIPFHVVDLGPEFARAVIDDFVEAYLGGTTPNPCVKCNQHIKFSPLLERARQIGADALVTGHYARIGGEMGLWRGVDGDKDQSYFLFAMPRDALAATWFPLGGMDKTAVRETARRLGLPNADKPESQEICFVPDGDHVGFVAKSALVRGRDVPAGGAIVDARGVELGRHDGTHRYTIGQHRGLGNLKTTDRMFVTAIDVAGGRVVVGPRDAAERARLVVRDVRWLAGDVGARFAAGVQVRHRGEVTPSTITVDGDGARVEVELSVPRIAAPGQAAVFYAGDRVIGGGWIA